MGDEEVYEIKRVDPKQPLYVSTIKLPEDILKQLEEGNFSGDELSITFTKDGRGSLSIGDQALSLKREGMRKDGRIQVFCLAHDHDAQSFSEVGAVTNKLTVDKDERNVRALIRNQTLNNAIKRKERQAMVINKPYKTTNGTTENKKISPLMPSSKRRLVDKSTKSNLSPSTYSKSSVTSFTSTTASSSSSSSSSTSSSSSSSLSSISSASTSQNQPPTQSQYHHPTNGNSSATSQSMTSKPTTKTKPLTVTNTPNSNVIKPTIPPPTSQHHSSLSTKPPVPSPPPLNLSPPRMTLTSPPTKTTKPMTLHKQNNGHNNNNSNNHHHQMSIEKPKQDLSSRNTSTNASSTLVKETVPQAPQASQSGIKIVNGKFIVASSGTTAAPAATTTTSTDVQVSKTGKRPRSPSSSSSVASTLAIPAPQAAPAPHKVPSSTHPRQSRPVPSNSHPHSSHSHSYDTSESTLCKLKPEITSRAQYDKFTEEFNSKYGKYTQMAEELNVYNRRVAELGAKYSDEKNEAQKKEIAQEIKNFYEKNYKQYHSKVPSYKKLHQELKAIKFRIKQYADNSIPK